MHRNRPIPVWISVVHNLHLVSFAESHVAKLAALVVVQRHHDTPLEQKMSGKLQKICFQTLSIPAVAITPPPPATPTMVVCEGEAVLPPES